VNFSQWTTLHVSDSDFLNNDETNAVVHTLPWLSLGVGIIIFPHTCMQSTVGEVSARPVGRLILAVVILSSVHVAWCTRDEITQICLREGVSPHRKFMILSRDLVRDIFWVFEQWVGWKMLNRRKAAWSVFSFPFWYRTPHSAWYLLYFRVGGMSLHTSGDWKRTVIISTMNTVRRCCGVFASLTPLYRTLDLLTYLLIYLHSRVRRRHNNYIFFIPLAAVIFVASSSKLRFFSS